MEWITSPNSPNQPPAVVLPKGRFISDGMGDQQTIKWNLLLRTVPALAGYAQRKGTRP
jgi:hypothetical protein